MPHHFKTIAAVLISGLMLGWLVMGMAQAAETRQITTFDNADFFGFDLRAEKNVSLERCKSSCLSDRQCRAFTYNSSAQWCFLKSDFNQLNRFEGAIAGKVVTVANDSARGADIGAAPQLAFLPENLYAEASREGAEIAKMQSADYGLAATTIAAEDALAAGNMAYALNAFRVAIAIDSSSADLWLGLAEATWRELAQNNYQGYEMQRKATSAALNAYQKSRRVDVRADALAKLARALAIQQQYRPALETYKESLALVDSPRVRAAFQDLSARKGFRVVEHTIDADSASARVCVVFSDPLVKSGVNYASFVTIDGRAASSVVAKDKQICAEGLEHGREYRVSLRAGLPADIGEVLLAPVTITAYVRDRSPTVRFTGDNFVLAKAGRKGIPVVSVNADKVEIELYRIGERSLAPLLAKSQFLRQLDGYDAGNIREDLGELVWQGDLLTQNELNGETVTSFPIDEALPERQPGVYVLMARVAGETLDNWSSRATQWLVVSDIGLSTLAGSDGLHVFARSLDSALPTVGLKLTLLARNNEILGEAITDENGRASFVAGLIRGKQALAPAVMTADNGRGDFVFLDMTRAGFDLSDRGVSGRPAPGPLDIFTWTDRGIYRAGETVHLSAMIRDDEAEAVSNLPLTFVVLRPDGKEDRRVVRTGGEIGGYGFDLEIPSNAMQGAWNVRTYADPKSNFLNETAFLVEDFRPDRIAFELDLPKSPLEADGVATARVDGRFLYGAPAAGLAVEAELKLKAVRARSEFPKYVFGLSDEDSIAARVNLANVPPLDAEGLSDIAIQLGTLPSTTHPLEAELTVRLSEGSGRAVERTGTMAVRPSGMMIGIRPEFEDGLVGENTTAAFKVIAAGPDGTTQDANGLKWSLLRIERNYQWYREGNSWRYEAVEFTRQIADRTRNINADAPADIASAVGWGRYRLVVESSEINGPATSIEFSAGWYVSAASTETPDGLEIALDKALYRVGETAQLQISARFAGQALITIANDGLRRVLTADVPEEGAVIEIPVADDWGAGAYVMVTLIRPGSDATSRMPSRAVGIQWLSVSPQDRALEVTMNVPEKIAPNSTLTIPVSVRGAGAHEEARFTLAAVDVGILNLTAFAPPDPQNWYFGQRRMGFEIRDLYGRLIDGSQGVTGRIRSGGDGPALGIKGSPPKERLVALHSGIVTLDDNGQALVSFDIPQFNGTLKLMAVAWTQSGVGQADRDLVVRDPVVITASLPKFLAPDDVSQLRFDFANTDGPSGEYALLLDVDPSLDIDRSGLGQTLSLARGQSQSLIVGVKAGQPGTSEIAMRLTAPDGTIIENVQQLEVRPATLPVTTRLELPLAANGGSAMIDRELLATSYLGGASVSIGISHANIDVPGLLMSLDRYPYGCAEQTTSRALPLLYLSELDAPAALLEDPGLRNRVQSAVERVLAYQSSEGSFGLWGPGGGDLWLNAYVGDFLTRAREKNYAVPEQAMRLALDNLQNVLSYNNDLADNGGGIAYALYVLARNKRASAGDLRYYADAQLDAFRSPLARAQIAAALALYGDAERAQRVFASAYRLAGSSQSIAHENYGSLLRDDAAMLALAGESRPVSPLLGDMVKLVSDRQMTAPARTTQEQAWMLLAARALQDTDRTLSLRVDGDIIEGAYSSNVDGSDLAARPIRIENDGDQPVTARVTSVAAPLEPLRAGGNGFEIDRKYYTMDGDEVAIEAVKQNERFVVVLTIRQTNALGSQILVTDLLPAGLEIDNSRLVESAKLANFSWLGETNPAHVEFRDDRFVAAFETSANDIDKAIQVAYVVRAVVPGIYTHPAAQVEDMYRPEFVARTATRWIEVKAAD